ncbi:hypothetical protein D3C71_1443700 [compost metagenome]
MPPATAYSATARRASADSGCLAAVPAMAGTAGSPALRSSAHAPAAASRFRQAAASAAPCTPKRGIRKKAGSKAPRIAPQVLAAYRAPPRRLAAASCRLTARSSTGKVPPIRKEGMASSRPTSSQAAAPLRASTATNGAALCASAQVTATQDIATATSSKA